MTERPILFNGPMVRAILEGRKTQTRRIVKHLHANEIDAWSFDDVLWRFGVFGDGGRVADMGGMRCPYGVPGDRLWVRETWYCDNYQCEGEALRRPSVEQLKEFKRPDVLIYRADGTCCQQFGECDHSGGVGSPFRPSIHMPRWASRLTLGVKAVRVERLHDISEEDAKAEGVEAYASIGPDQRVPGPGFNRALLRDQPHRLPFADLWCSINGEDAWAANPWVWVVEFEVLK